MTLRVAIVGTGYFSRFHYDAWSRLNDVQPVGAASLDPDGLAGISKRFGIDAVFDDVGDMLDRTRPDLLDVVVPPRAHQALVEEAAVRGIHVICQKPLGGDLATAKAMVDRAEKAGIVFAVHENFRFQPWYREAKRVIEDGHLGDVTNISFRLRPGDGQGPRAYLDRQPYFQTMKRFLIHETAIHLVDSFRYLMGEVTGVFARLQKLNPAIQGEDAGYVVLHSTPARPGCSTATASSAFPPRIRD